MTRPSRGEAPSVSGVEELERLAQKLRVTTAQMAKRCSVDMVLWNVHSNACLEAATVLSALKLSRSERAMALEEAAQWHDQRAHDTPDAFEMEFHQASAKAIRALSPASEGDSSGAVAPPLPSTAGWLPMASALINLRSFIKCGAHTNEIEAHGLRLVDALEAALTSREQET